MLLYRHHGVALGYDGPHARGAVLLATCMGTAAVVTFVLLL